MVEDEWFAVWMLRNMKKRKRMDKFEYQAFSNVVEESGYDILEKFETKFKEMRVERHRKVFHLSCMQKMSMTIFLILNTQGLNLNILRLCTWVLRMRPGRYIKDKVLLEDSLLIGDKDQIQEIHITVDIRDSRDMMDINLEIEQKRRNLINHRLLSNL